MMKMMAVLAGVVAAVAFGAAGDASAQTKMERCTVGQRVKTPGGLPATVVAAKGGGCTIKTDAGNTFVDGTFAAFMLTPIGPAPRAVAPASTASTATLPLGEYACYGSGMRVLAGLGFRLLPGGRYADLDGKSGPIRDRGPGDPFHRRAPRRAGRARGRGQGISHRRAGQLREVVSHMGLVPSRAR
ncbi:hypothetical protein AB5I41_15770 [Sphingomonas sp. MMS24-JH45]